MVGNQARVVGFFCVTAALAGVSYAHDHPTAQRSMSSTPYAAVFHRALNELNLAIDFSLSPAVKPGSAAQHELQAQEPLYVRVVFKDPVSGRPRGDVRPKAWLNLRRSDQVAEEISCRDKIKGFLKGTLSGRADVDLNAYSLLVLNHDNSISYINPQVGLNTSKLERLITLPGQGRDWALSQSQQWLYVTIPDKSAVAVIKTDTGEVAQVISTGDKTTPSRLALEPDDRRLWVGLDYSSTLVAVDTQTHHIIKSIDIGKGLHTLAFSSDHRYIAVTNTADDTVTLIGLDDLTVAATVPTSRTPVALAYSRASGFFYAVGLNGDTVTVIDPQARQVVATIPIKAGVVALRFEPEGNIGLAINQIEGTVSALDAFKGQIIATAAVVKEPDQVTVTQHFAYVRGIGSDKFSLIDLSLLKKGSLAVTDIPAGHTFPQSTPSDLNVADMIVPTPDGHGAWIAHAPERALYYYMEGMMVPMGTLQTYQRRPHAVLVLNRSLVQADTGRYEAVVTFPSAGTYDLHLLTENPPTVVCMPLQVKASSHPGDVAETVKERVRIQRLFDNKPFPTGTPVSLRFKILDAQANQPMNELTDVQVLLFEPPGTWQQRVGARGLGNGVYEITPVFPHPGQYRVTVQISSMRVSFDARSATTVTVQR
ncbi:MAG TPA: hypothetical protein PKD12_12275 [Nitrospira sp.]|nr:hypothetical protein [Nitrospira sp.]